MVLILNCNQAGRRLREEWKGDLIPGLGPGVEAVDAASSRITLDTERTWRGCQAGFHPSWGRSLLCI